MPITGSFNGWNIVSFPLSPAAPATIDWELHDTVAQTTSPYTNQTQTQIWAGCDFWAGEFSMPPLTNAQRAAWLVFLAELRGVANVFQMSDPKCLHPTGDLQGAVPVVDGTVGTNNQSASTQLYIRGLKANSSRVLMPGDKLQIGYRLHMILGAPVNADSSGKANFPIYPSIREAPSDGASITLSSPKGLFRLAENMRKVHDQVRLAAVGVKFQEAL
jgi:hypothetical protein